MRGGEILWCWEGRIWTLLRTKQALLSNVIKSYWNNLETFGREKYQKYLSKFSAFWKVLPRVHELHTWLSERGKWRHSHPWSPSTQSPPSPSPSNPLGPPTKDFFEKVKMFKICWGRFWSLLNLDFDHCSSRFMGRFPPMAHTVQYFPPGGNTPFSHHRCWLLNIDLWFHLFVISMICDFIDLWFHWSVISMICDFNDLFVIKSSLIIPLLPQRWLHSIEHGEETALNVIF